MYLFSTSASVHSEVYLTPCVHVVVLGFFTPTEASCKDLLQMHPLANAIQVDSKSAMYKHLICAFSPTSSTVLDMTTDEVKGIYHTHILGNIGINCMNLSDYLIFIVLRGYCNLCNYGWPQHTDHCANKGNRGKGVSISTRH